MSPQLPSRPLGDSGIDVSTVGLGCNNFGRRLDLDRTAEVIDAAIGAGITLLDTADIYGGSGGSEELIGRVLEGRRDSVVLATKFGMDMGDDAGAPAAARGSREYIRWAIEGSLRRLRTDRIDLYQYHEPDGVTPIGETLDALAELVDEGVVAAIGCSNFDAGLLDDAASHARGSGGPRFVTLQNEYSLLEREIEADVAPACERLGVGILPYFPLASGLLSGKYERGRPAPEGSRLHGRGEVAGDAQFDVIEALARFAAGRGVGLIDVAIAGLAAQPAVASVIAGATSADQVRSNVAALRWEPTAADLRELDEIAPTPRD